jgi:hypothetical protein
MLVIYEGGEKGLSESLTSIAHAAYRAKATFTSHASGPTLVSRLPTPDFDLSRHDPLPNAHQHTASPQ